TLCLLALFASLFALPAHAQKPAATRGRPAQKQSDAQKKPAAALKKPDSRQARAREVAPAARARELGPSILIRWQGRPGVERYRLQLATDEAFTDIVFDQAVQGRQYVVKGLPPGNYFWRVAAAAAETSAAYSRPE